MNAWTPSAGICTKACRGEPFQFISHASCPINDQHFKLSEWKVFTQILFPSVLPHLMAGIRQSIGVAWLVATSYSSKITALPMPVVHSALASRHCVVGLASFSRGAQASPRRARR